MEQAASDLRQILGGKRLPRGGVYAPGGAQLGMGGPPQVGPRGGSFPQALPHSHRMTLSQMPPQVDALKGCCAACMLYNCAVKEPTVCILAR